MMRIGGCRMPAMKSVFVGAMAMIGLLATAVPAMAQTPYANYQDEVTQQAREDNRGAGATVHTIHAGGVFANDERGIHAGVMIGGLSDFTLGVDHLFFWQQQPDGSDPRMHKTRISLGINALEIYSLAYLRFEISMVIGEVLLGGGDYFNAGMGLFLTLPVAYGPDGWPIVRLSGGYSTDPILNFDDGWRAEAFVSVYPFVGTPIRGFGVHLGVMYGAEETVPYNMFYAGLIYGAPI